MQYPRPLQPGDKVVILSPASKIKPELVDGACTTLRNCGLIPIVSAHCKGEHGSYSGTVEERLTDLTDALADPEVRAIICSRGGYGVVHLLPHLTAEAFRRDPKWIVGFSDISALHAASVTAGVASIHASMCKHLTNHPEDQCNTALMNILRGHMPEYRLPAHPYNRCGEAEGRLVGGNMAVLTGLVSTPFDLLTGDNILFIEDIAEAIYKVERMLYTLRLNGTLARTKGLIVGRFTLYEPDRDHKSMEEMITEMVADYDFPVVFDFPLGHVDENMPLIEGCHARLSVTPESVTLKMSR